MDKLVCEDVYYGEIPENLVEMIAFWQGQLDAIGYEYRHTASVEFEWDNIYGSTVTLSYKRPETPAEEKFRMVAAADAAERKKQRELAELARLKALHETE